MSWFFIRSTEVFFNNPDPTVIVTLIGILGFLFSLVIRLATGLRSVILDYLYFLADVEADKLRSRILEEYSRKHPPQTTEDLNLLLQQVHRSEQYHYDQMKSYNETVGKNEDSALKLFWEWFINRRLGK